MSDEFRDIQKLIRLKRYERPPQGYFEDFLEEFQSRQRAELLQRSARSLLAERVGMYFSGLGRQRWIYGAGLAYAVVMLGVFLWPDHGGQSAVQPASPEASSVLWDQENLVLHTSLVDKSLQPLPRPARIDISSDFETVDTPLSRRSMVVLPPPKILPVSNESPPFSREY
jgi:hypothetical protein